MHAGQLTQRITLQRRTRVPDGAGGNTDTWTLLAVVWANLAPLTGRDRIAADQKNPERTHTITIRYRTDLTGIEVRARVGARVFDLAPPIDVDEAHEWLAFDATEVTG